MRPRKNCRQVLRASLFPFFLLLLWQLLGAAFAVDPYEHEQEYGYDDPYLEEDMRDAKKELEQTLGREQEDFERFFHMMDGMGFSEEEMEHYHRESGGDLMALMDIIGTQGGREGGPSLSELIEGNAEDMMREFLGRFSLMSEPEFKAFLSSFFSENEGSFMDRHIGQNEKLITFLARLLQHPDAVPKAASIADDRKKFLIFVLVNIAIIVLNFFIRRYQRINNRLGSIKVAMKQWFLRATGITLLRFSVLIIFFGAQLYPGFQVFQSVFLS